MRLVIALILALSFHTEANGKEVIDGWAVDYIVKIHDEKTKCNPCITRKRAREYVRAIRKASITHGVPFNYSLGLIGWESAGFQNTIDKRGSGSKILDPVKWCWGMGKLKVSTANDFTREVLGWRREHITGRDLLYDYEMNIDISIAYLAWCLNLKGNSITRAFNAYKAGPTGERKGNYMMTITMPWGEKIRKTYAECVIHYSVNRWLSYIEKRVTQ